MQSNFNQPGFFGVEEYKNHILGGKLTMKTVSIIYVDGTQHIYDDVKKVWLENSTKRYILHRVGADDREHHTFINRENVLEFDIMDPDGWKTEKDNKRKNRPQKGYYTSYARDRENEDVEE